MSYIDTIKGGFFMSDFDKIQSLLQERADCNARINLIPYEGEDINVISNFLKEKCWKTF